MILKISLQPLDKFFFGGEASFNEIGKKENRRSSYILHSRYFPQQTGALGLIRNQLLLQSGLLKDNTARVNDRKRAKVLIGETGFRLGANQNQFGVIKRISPVFLEAEEGQICLPAPLDDVLMPTVPETGEVKMIFHLEDDIPLLMNFIEKEGLTPSFQYPNWGNLKTSSLFNENQQVGITKAARPWGTKVDRKDDESGYYYQTFLGFSPDKHKLEKGSDKKSIAIKRFCLFVELKDQIEQEDILFEWKDHVIEEREEGGYTLQSAIVEFGGERSTFKMEVNKLMQDTWVIPQLAYKYTELSKDLEGSIRRLVCISPTYIEDLPELKNLTVFRASQTIPFRFLKSNINHTEYFQDVDRQHKGQNPSRKTIESKLFHLFDRGSVFYFKKDQQTDLEALIQHNDFQTIGYNQYQIL